MKKKLILLLTLIVASVAANAQTRGIRIGYIDMDYILEKVPDYAEAKNQLEQKAQKWKQEIEAKKNEINKLKDGLKTEKTLLTRELIAEREEEIAFQETELLDFQEKRFGPKGDLVSQKAVLVKPIQDQVFNAVQDIAEAKKFDFVFDKSSDLTILFAAQRHDISDQVIRVLTRATKREQMSKKQLKEEEAKEAVENLADENPEFAERQKKLEEKKTQRDSLIAQRKEAQEAKRQASEEKREQLKQEREAKKNGTAVSRPAKTDTTDTPTTQSDLNSGDDDEVPQKKPAAVSTKDEPAGKNDVKGKTTAADAPEDGKPTAAEKQQAAQAEHDRKLEERKKAIEEKRKKILADREAAKKAKEEQKSQNKPQPQQPQEESKPEENKNEN